MRSQNLMATFRRSKGGRRSKAIEGCKKHPKHKQSPGVCSLCLQQKLSQLSFEYSVPRCRIPVTVDSSICSSSSSSSSSSSLSSYYSSASTSASSSPMHSYHLVREGKGNSFPLLLFSGMKRNCGFFSKLLHHHSNTTTMVH
ncbi:hypothetical protein ERO13_A06G033600v2 [Gossypium hirsutum]|uniref:Uncharacterized protein n=5 Tax=Gossypium TaxID=3633 RepID=A0ABM3BUY0_GOSHI|nr:uncharacterized protein LOC121230341 [Gossypium hirsutum]KAB2076407.1 hypothetical protein ES319_A06G038700v1 [Gossypium barbadense]TYH12110.1 hypothetical protein ES288_A06G040100v1 [Gossypium darwinii]TYI21478.1 hypothetical protein ES332_A06G039500v1 [Gossypium tomentosum]TYJ28977.1 hypothetical protein E1A91_A06G037800v1 [Gossypium mustelinum]KAG4194107.1 hypothetical protein ERO13_A06G033600v2 [Gossypium hirsutum]